MNYGKTKMDRSVRPVEVSPLIKGLRWSFLALGIFYGVVKLEGYKAYEMSVRPKRLQQIKEKYERLKKESGGRDTKEILTVAKEFEIEELPPGWNDEL